METVKMAKKPKGARERRKRRREDVQQTHFEGMEPPRIAAIDTKAKEYRAVVLERMELTDQETKLKEKLMDLMHEHNLTVYPIPDTDLEVVLEVVDETVKVRKRKKPPAEKKGE